MIHVAPQLFSTLVSLLLSSGLTASVSLMLGATQPGETVAVTEACSAVGFQAVQLAKMLGCKVHLRLHVTIDKDWTKNPRVLKALGLE